MQRPNEGLQRRCGATLSKERFAAQLPRALSDLEEGDSTELQLLMDARLGNLCRAGVDEILAAGEQALSHILEALTQVVQVASSMGTRPERLRDVHNMLETLQKLQGCHSSRAGKEEQVPMDLAPKALLARLQRLRRESGDCFKSGERQAAALQLEKALQLLQPYKHRWLGAAAQKGGSSLEQLRVTHAAVLMNLSLCYLQGQPPAQPPQPARVLECCREALELGADNSKAHYRKGKALLILGLPAQAEQELVRAAELDPADAGILKDLGLAREASLEQARARDFATAADQLRWHIEDSHGGPEVAASELEVPSTLTSASLSPPPPATVFAAASATWPMLATARAALSIDEVQASVETVAKELAEGGQIGSFADALESVVTERVCQHYGQAARGRLARVGTLIRNTAAGSASLASRPGDCPLASAYLEDLSPEQPLHEARDHSWCTAIASSAGSILQELREEVRDLTWEEPVPWGFPHPANSWLQDLPQWRTVVLVEKGIWVADDRFSWTRALLGKLPGLRPAAVGFARLSPGTEAQLHWDSSNFLMGAHFCLEDEEGCSLRIGAQQTRALRAGQVVITGHLWEHAVRNEAREDRHVLSCFFYHPGVDEVERYALQVLELLADGLEAEGAEGLRHPAASGARSA